MGYVSDDSGVDDSYTVDPIYEPWDGVYRTLILEKFAADNSGLDDSSSGDSAADETNSDDIYYTLATSELADGNAPLAAGADDTDDFGADDSDSGSGDVDGTGYDDTGIDDGSSDDNGTDEYILTAEQSALAVNGGKGGNRGNGGNLSENANANSGNSIPMQHTGLPILPALLGVLSLVGGFAINKNRS